MCPLDGSRLISKHEIDSQQMEDLPSVFPQYTAGVSGLCTTKQATGHVKLVPMLV